MQTVQLRHLVRDMIGPTVALRLPDYVANVVPCPLQRLSERHFDFPIRQVVRNAHLLFIRIPRNASASVSKAVYGTVDSVPHRTALFYRTSDPAMFESKVKFAIVRNPWRRAMSAYNFLRQGGSDLAGPNAHTRKAMARIRSFESFIFDYIAPKAKQLHHLDPTVHSQSSYVCDRSGKSIVDHVFRLEDLAPLAQFLKSNDIIAPVVAANCSSGECSFEELMTPDIVKAIGEIYHDDIRLFGYAPPAATTNPPPLAKIA